MNSLISEPADGAAPAPRAGSGLLAAAVVLASHKKLVLLLPILVGACAFGIAFTIPPVYTSRTSFLPPQQQQSSAVAALAALAPLAGAGGPGVKSTADQYVSLMQSVNVRDRIIDKFNLQAVYEKKFRSDTRRELDKNVRITAGKKDGIIALEVDDTDPKRSADIANMHVEELRRLTGQLALTEAQLRRVFFEKQLDQTKTRLVSAQMALQASGYSDSTLKAEPKAAAEDYARLKAQVTEAEVRLQTMRGYLNNGSAELQTAQGVLVALRQQLAKLEGAVDTHGDPDYVGRYREFKYQETLFDLYARQYELARADESRESALIQVIDPATPPDRKSRPSRALIAIVATLLSGLAIAGCVLLADWWRRLQTSDTSKRDMLLQLRKSLFRF